MEKIKTAEEVLEEARKSFIKERPAVELAIYKKHLLARAYNDLRKKHIDLQRRITSSPLPDSIRANPLSHEECFIPMDEWRDKAHEAPTVFRNTRTNQETSH
jgi:hypothetical protein